MKIVYQDVTGKIWDTEAECVKAEYDASTKLTAYNLLTELIESYLGQEKHHVGEIADFVITQYVEISKIMCPVPNLDEHIFEYEGVKYKAMSEEIGCNGCAFNNAITGTEYCLASQDTLPCGEHRIIWFETN